MTEMSNLLSGFGQEFEALGRQPEQKVITLKMRMVTPMIGGGAEAGRVDLDDPFRASAVVGQLRELWRMRCGHEFRSKEELQVAEARIWGSSSSPGSVQVRVEDAVVKGEVRVAQGRKCPPSIPSFVGSILLQARDDTFEHLDPPASLTVTLVSDPCSDKDWEQVKKTADLYRVLGSFGARRTRGCGALAPAAGEELEIAEVQKHFAPAPSSPLKGKIDLCAGGLVMVSKTTFRDAKAAWFHAANAYQALCRGIRSDAAMEHIQEILGSQNFWEGMGPSDPDLRHTTWKREKQTLANARWEPGHPNKAFTSRAEFGLPRAQGHNKPELWHSPGKEGRRTSPIIIRPLYFRYPNAGKMVTAIHAGIIVLSARPLAPGDAKVSNGAEVVQEIEPHPDLLSRSLAAPVSLISLCCQYFEDLGFGCLVGRP